MKQIIVLIQPHPTPPPHPPCFFTLPIMAYIVKGEGKYEWWTY